MRLRLRLALGFVLGLLIGVALVAAGCDDPVANEASDMAVPASSGYVSPPTAIHGQYLVDHLLFCGNCHTPTTASGAPDSTKALAGGKSFTVTTTGTATATIYAGNLTNDSATGLGSWSDDQIKSAITKGIDNEGKALYPTMPYGTYAGLDDSDVESIVLYLRSLSVANAVPANVAPPPAAPAAALDDSLIPHSTLAATDPLFAAAERGRYLAKLSCVGCHTPRVAGATDYTRTFAGGVVYKSAAGVVTAYSTNLTPDASGLKGWSNADFAKTLRANQEKGSGRFLVAPMPSGASKLGGLTDADLDDMATFFLHLTPIANGPFGISDGGVPFSGADGGV